MRDTGIARTTGGSVAVVSGVATLAGLAMAPFTAGLSLILTAGGIVGAIASAATTLTAAIIKDKNVNEEAKKFLDSLKDKDEVVCRIIDELQIKVKKLRSLYGKKSIKSFIEDSTKVAEWIEKVGYKILYKGYTVYSSVKAIRFATAVAEFIQADIYAMRGIATGISAPGLSIFGETLILAKVLGGVFGVVGIGFGIWDIVGGAVDINGSKHAEAYRKAAGELDRQTDEYDELLNKIKIA